MAGGMNRRHDRIPLHERVRGTAERSVSPPVKRCLVLDADGAQPGLLLDWRQTSAGWQGRVARPVRKASSWAVVVEWVAAERLRADP